MNKDTQQRVLEKIGSSASGGGEAAKNVIDLFAAGNALMEATVRADEEILRSAGVWKGGMQLADGEEMARMEARWKERIESLVPAGAECNVATGMACLGGSAYFSGRIGCDASGNRYQKRLHELGVDAGLVRGTGRTGLILSFVTPDGERSMLTHLGEASRFSPADLDMRQIEVAKVVFISAFFFQPETTRPTAFRVAEMSRLCRVPIAFDLSDGMAVRSNGDLIKCIIERYADIVFLNQDEAQALACVCGEQAENYLSRHVETFVIKKGKHGATIFCRNEMFHVDAFPAEVVDSTGAGDAFAAGFLFARLRGLGPADAGKEGCRLASRVVAQYGSCLPGKDRN